MKKFNTIIILFVLCIATSCQKDFLERQATDTIAEDRYLMIPP